MRIVGISEYEDQFLELCRQFYDSNDRNKDWFNPDLKWSIRNTYWRFPHWSFLLDDQDQFIAMSAVQTHNFTDNCARILTRTYYSENARRKHISYETSGMTPAMYMFKDQLDWTKQAGIDNLFFSVEYMRRKATIKKLTEKIKTKYNETWTVLDNLYQTYPVDDDPDSWQVVCANNPSLPLKNMSVEQWKKIYDR
jgi:hypothetical protein